MPDAWKSAEAVAVSKHCVRAAGESVQRNISGGMPRLARAGANSQVICTYSSVACTYALNISRMLRILGNDATVSLFVGTRSHGKMRQAARAAASQSMRTCSAHYFARNIVCTLGILLPIGALSLAFLRLSLATADLRLRSRASARSFALYRQFR